MMDSQDAAAHPDRPKQTTAGCVGESPGLPGLHTWRAVYLFVLAAFVLVVVLFALFSWYFA